MKRLLILLALVPVLFLTACSDFGLKGEEFNPVDVIINIAAIAGVTPPAMGETPVTTVTATDQYTGTLRCFHRLHRDDHADRKVRLHADRRSVKLLYGNRIYKRHEPGQFRRGHGGVPGNCRSKPELRASVQHKLQHEIRPRRNLPDRH